MDTVVEEGVPLELWPHEKQGQPKPPEKKPNARDVEHDNDWQGEEGNDGCVVVGARTWVAVRSKEALTHGTAPGESQPIVEPRHARLWCNPAYQVEIGKLGYVYRTLNARGIRDARHAAQHSQHLQLRSRASKWGRSVQTKTERAKHMPQSDSKTVSSAYVRPKRSVPNLGTWL